MSIKKDYIFKFYSPELDFIVKKLNINNEKTFKNKIYLSDVSHLFNIVCEKNSSEAVDYLLKIGADINSDGIHYRRPLWWVVWNGNEYLLKKLINLNCELNFFDKETGYTPLDLAVSKGNYGICKLLLEAGAIHFTCGYLFKFIENPLFVSIKQENAMILQLLIYHGFSVNTVNKDGWTPLSMAVEYNNKAIINILLRNGANMSYLIRDYSPVRMALDKDLDDVIQMFVNYGLDINSTVVHGIHPLLYSVIMKAEKSAFVLVTNGSKFPGDLTKLIFLAYMERMWKFINLLIRIYPGKYSPARFKGMIQKSDCLINLCPRLQWEKSKILMKLERESKRINSLQHLSRLSLISNLGCHYLYELMKQLILPEKLFNYVISAICEDGM